MPIASRIRTGLYVTLGFVLWGCSGAVGTKADATIEIQTSTALSRSTVDANVVATQVLPYQQPTVQSTSLIPPSIKYGYTGKRLDPESDQNDYGARSYASRQMHFTTADSVVPNPMEPQSFNRYAYVKNNPMRYVDPTGHAEIDFKKYPGVWQREQLLRRDWKKIVGTLDPEHGKALAAHIEEHGFGSLGGAGETFMNDIETDGDFVSRSYYAVMRESYGDDVAILKTAEFVNNGLDSGGLDLSGQNLDDLQGAIHKTLDAHNEKIAGLLEKGTRGARAEATLLNRRTLALRTVDQNLSGKLWNLGEQKGFAVVGTSEAGAYGSTLATSFNTPLRAVGSGLAIAGTFAAGWDIGTEFNKGIHGDNDAWGTGFLNMSVLSVSLALPPVGISLGLAELELKVPQPSSGVRGRGPYPY